MDVKYPTGTKLAMYKTLSGHFELQLSYPTQVPSANLVCHNATLNVFIVKNMYRTAKFSKIFRSYKEVESISRPVDS